MASVRKRSWKTSTAEIKTAWVVDYADNRGDRQRKHFANKKAADAFRVSIEAQLLAGTHRPDASKLSVAQTCADFLTHCAGRHERDERMTRKWLAVYRGHVNNHILSAEYGVAGGSLRSLLRERLRSFEIGCAAQG